MIFIIITYVFIDQIQDGGRRRTPGGVYIQLMKFSPKYTSDMHKIIFKEDFEERAKEKRRQ